MTEYLNCKYCKYLLSIFGVVTFNFSTRLQDSVRGFSLRAHTRNKDKDFIKLDPDDFTILIHMGVSATNDKLKYSYGRDDFGCYSMLNICTGQVLSQWNCLHWVKMGVMYAAILKYSTPVEYNEHLAFHGLVYTLQVYKPYKK